MSRRSPVALIITLLAVSAHFACQKIQEPVPTPTTDQWRRVQENLLAEAPEPTVSVGAVFGDSVRLIGWDIEPAEVEVGEEFELVLYWEVLQEVPDRWHIFVHFDSNTRQNFDHEAVEGIYKSVYWQPGDIISDRIEGTLDSATEPGAVNVLVGLFRDDERMDVTDPGSGTVEADGRLTTGSFEASWDPPTYLVRYASTPIRLDGRQTDAAWRAASSTGEWVHPANGEGPESGMRTSGKLLWDAEYLYVSMTASDFDVWATMSERDQHLWEEEVLEFYFDGSGEGRNYVELQVNPLNAVFDAVFPSAEERDLDSAKAVDLVGLETAVNISGDLEDRENRDRSWTVEARIPWASLPGFESGSPAPGRRARANFYRYDRPEGEDARTVAWSPVGSGTFHRPDRFGELTFAAPPREAVQDGSGEGSGATTGVRPNLRRTPPNLRPTRNVE